MPIDLLKYALGQREVDFLDDQKVTIESERALVGEAGAKEKTFSDPGSFLKYLKDQEDVVAPKIKAEERTTRLVVVDNSIRGVEDIRVFSHIANFASSLPRGRDVWDTNNGARAGLILIEYVVWRDETLSQLPVLLISGYHRPGDDRRIQQMIDAAGKGEHKPFDFVPKVNVSHDQEKFKNATIDMLYHPYLTFMHRLANFWGLESDQVCALLGIRGGDLPALGAMFDDTLPFPSVDPEQRVKHLFAIRRMLSNRFDDRETELSWLNEPKGRLGKTAPMELMLDGESDRLAAVRHYVEQTCGW